MKIADLVQEYLDREAPNGPLVDDTQATACAIEATRLYSAYGDLTDATAVDIATITPDTVLTVSEWGVIRPLFRLYCERDAASAVEASRSMGVEVFGRSVSEIASEITQAELAIPHQAFEQEPFTVGMPVV